jgi:hypothetical protein
MVLKFYKNIITYLEGRIIIIQVGYQSLKTIKKIKIKILILNSRKPSN